MKNKNEKIFKRNGDSKNYDGEEILLFLVDSCLLMLVRVILGVGKTFLDF